MEYRSAKTLSIVTICALGVCVLSQVATGIAGFIQILAPEQPLAGSGLSIPLIVEAVGGSIYTLTYVLSAIVFLIWLNRAHKNLQFLKPDLLEFTSGWAVGWWFIPFATLWKPFQVVREVWAESDPDFDPDQPQYLSYSLHAAPAYMVVWWIAWLVMLFALNIGRGLVKIPGLTTTNFGAIVFFQAVVVIFAGVLAITVVRDITTRQESRHQRIGPSKVEFPPPPPTFGDQE